MKPPGPTVNGQLFEPDELALFHPDYPGETMIERARRLDILDVWIPTITLTYSSNHRLTFTDDRALALWEAWKARIYGNSKG